MKVLIENESPIIVVSRHLVNSLHVKTNETDFAANMRYGHSHVLAETIEPPKVHTGPFQERLRLALRDVCAYDLIMGKKWRDAKDSKNNHKKN